MIYWMCGEVAHSLCTTVKRLLNPRNIAESVWCQTLSRSTVRVCNR